MTIKSNIIGGALALSVGILTVPAIKEAFSGQYSSEYAGMCRIQNDNSSATAAVTPFAIVAQSEGLLDKSIVQFKTGDNSIIEYELENLHVGGRHVSTPLISQAIVQKTNSIGSAFTLSANTDSTQTTTIEASKSFADFSNESQLTTILSGVLRNIEIGCKFDGLVEGRKYTPTPSV